MVFKSWEGKAALQFLRLEALSHGLIGYSDQDLLVHLRKAVTQSVGLNKIQELKRAAIESIGLLQGAAMAKLELTTLLNKYDSIQTKYEELDSKIDSIIEHIHGV